MNAGDATRESMGRVEDRAVRVGDAAAQPGAIEAPAGTPHMGEQFTAFLVHTAHCPNRPPTMRRHGRSAGLKLEQRQQVGTMLSSLPVYSDVIAAGIGDGLPHRAWRTGRMARP